MNTIVKKIDRRKKTNFKTIFDNNCAFGGHECHVTSDGETVHVKHRYAPAASTFKIVAKMPISEWYKFVEENDLSNKYKQDPGILVRAFVAGA
jgi:hypothetical protein